jgi:hypothetical protein
MSAASVAGMRVNQNGSSNPIHFPFSNPLKTSCSCRSRGNEAHFHSGNNMSSEPPYVGCYFFNGRLGLAGNTWPSGNRVAA